MNLIVIFNWWIEGGYAIKTPSFEVEEGKCRKRPPSVLWFGGSCLSSCDQFPYCFSPKLKVKTTLRSTYALTKSLFLLLNFHLGAKFRKYVGHSAHVTNVRFSHDMMRVISVGGGDHAIFQWRFLPEGSHGDDGDEGDGGAYLESNSDDSDSEASDVDELDSDIENVRKNAYLS